MTGKMTIKESLVRAIWQRNAERAKENEPPIDEMFLHPATYDRVVPPGSEFPSLMNVRLRRMGS